MNLKMIIFACLLFVAHAERQGLKSQKATDIAGSPEHHVTGYDHKDDVPHISFDAYANAEVATKKFVRKMLVDGLREQFNSFKESFTQFADDEGFVREGISFCGAPSTNAIPSEYKPNTGRLIENDGVGDSESFNETGVCSKKINGLMVDQCDENSIVGALSRLIRGMGLNIHHQDICNAVINPDESEIAEPDVFTMTLEKFATTRYERSCSSKTKADQTTLGRHFERNGKCFGTRNDQCTHNCTFFPRENTCFAIESANKFNAACGGDPDICDIVAEHNETRADYEVRCTGLNVNCSLVDFTGLNAGCSDVTNEKNAIEPDQFVNAARRATSYGMTQLTVESTDYAWVTGCSNGTSCNSLRSVIAALNGNAQVNAFRDLGMEEAAGHWLNEIATIKGYLVDFSYQLTNFRDISLEIFPYIEDEEIEGCPMGETKFEDHITGTDEEPLCYQKNLNTTKLNTMDKTGQSFSRSKCLCRNGELGRSMEADKSTRLEPNAYSKVEQDDIYLSVNPEYNCDLVEAVAESCTATDPDDPANVVTCGDVVAVEAVVATCLDSSGAVDTDCTAASPNKDACEEVTATDGAACVFTAAVDAASLSDKCGAGCTYDAGVEEQQRTLPVSAYTYCKKMQTWGDQPAWTATLTSLLPPATKSRIKIYEYDGAADLSAKRLIFVKNVANTLPSELETSCGRIVNADSEASGDLKLVKRSNRGGNCFPFAKLHEILYRLEFETGSRDMGDYLRGSNADANDSNFNGNGAGAMKMKDLYCADGTFSGNAFSFRQLSYKWDSAAKKGEDTPMQETLIQNWFNTHSLSTDAEFENARYTKRFVEGGDDVVGDAPFCHPHWVYQIGGDVGRTDAYGQIFEDPYILLREEVQEAVFNTKLAQAAKTMVREDNAVIWRYIESQLTENKPGTVVDHLGAAAGTHYMKIWVDEHS